MPAAAPAGPPDADVVDLAEVMELPLVGVPKNVAFHRMLADQLREHGMPELPAVIRLGHAEAIKRAVAVNGWVGLAPRYCVEDDVAAGRLRAVAIRDASLVEGIGLYHRSAKYFSPLQRAALTALRRTAERKRAIRGS